MILPSQLYLGSAIRSVRRAYAGCIFGRVRLQVLTFGNASGHHRILDSALTIVPGEEPPVLRMMKDRCSREMRDAERQSVEHYLQCFIPGYRYFCAPSAQSGKDAHEWR